jgi:hypothetical protein
MHDPRTNAARIALVRTLAVAAIRAAAIIAFAISLHSLTMWLGMHCTTYGRIELSRLPHYKGELGFASSVWLILGIVFATTSRKLAAWVVLAPVPNACFVCGYDRSGSPKDAPCHECGVGG